MKSADHSYDKDHIKNNHKRRKKKKWPPQTRLDPPSSPPSPSHLFSTVTFLVSWGLSHFTFCVFLWPPTHHQWERFGTPGQARPGRARGPSSGTFARNDIHRKGILLTFHVHTSPSTTGSRGTHTRPARAYPPRASRCGPPLGGYNPYRRGGRLFRRPALRRKIDSGGFLCLACVRTCRGSLALSAGHRREIEGSGVVFFSSFSHTKREKVRESTIL